MLLLYNVCIYNKIHRSWQKVDTWKIKKDSKLTALAIVINIEQYLGASVGAKIIDTNIKVI